MNRINEATEYGDLNRLVNPVLSIDEFRSKMGEDKDIMVFGITVFGKDPATDLVNFLEKSYDWVLDADLSSGETSDGNYIVFIEVKRDRSVIKMILHMIDDLTNLTEQTIDDWKFNYYKSKEQYPVDEEHLSKYLITSPEQYEKRINKEVQESYELKTLQALSGVMVAKTKITEMQIVNLQDRKSTRLNSSH